MIGPKIDVFSGELLDHNYRLCSLNILSSNEEHYLKLIFVLLLLFQVHAEA